MPLHSPAYGPFALLAAVILISATATAAATLALPRRQFWITAAIALWIPATVLAFQMPSLLSPTETTRNAGHMLMIAVIQGILLSPALSLPILTALSKAHPSLARTAQGLGAGPLRRIAILWFPLLRYRLFFSLGLGALLTVLLASTLLFHTP